MTQRRNTLFRPAPLALAVTSSAALLGFLGACGGDDSNTLDTSGSGADGAGADGSGGGVSIGGNGQGGDVGIGGVGQEGNDVVTEPQGAKFGYSCGDVRAFKDGASADTICSQFNSATPDGSTPGGAGAPVMTYPLNGTLMPPNLPSITFHWTQETRVAENWRIELTGADGETFYFFFSCAQTRCDRTLETTEFNNEWRWLGWKYRGQKVTVQITGLKSDNTTFTSAPVEVEFSPDYVRGALYYWAANRAGPGIIPSEGVIMRTSVGSDGAVPFIEPSPYRDRDTGGFLFESDTASATNDFNCSACHSVSRDGKTIAFAVLGGDPGGGEEANNVSAIQVAKTTDPENPIIEPARGGPDDPAAWDSKVVGWQPTEKSKLGMNVALNPDGSVALVSGVNAVEDGGWPPYLEARRTSDNSVIGKWELSDPVFGENRVGLFPEFSPDGNLLAVTLGDTTGDPVVDQQGCVWPAGTCRSGIAIMPVNGGALGTASILVDHDPTTLEYHYYPTWSPDGQWIAFVSATFDPSARVDGGLIVNSQKATDAVIRVVRAAVPATPYTCPSADCIELKMGQGEVGRSLTWPKFTPFAQGDGGSLWFLSFTSKQPYGNKFDVNTGNNRDQLWMMAIDKATINAGSDGSRPPFWLPYQNDDEDNLTPYWSEELPCEASGDDGGCSGCRPGETCQVNTATNECSCVATGPTIN